MSCPDTMFKHCDGPKEKHCIYIYTICWHSDTVIRNYMRRCSVSLLIKDICLMRMLTPDVLGKSDANGTLLLAGVLPLNDRGLARLHET